MKKLAGLMLIALGAAVAADQAVLERGQKEEQRACIACHSLRLIHSQRLARATWEKEVTKMAGWGSKIDDRAALMEYLVANFGDDKPAIPAVLSISGVPAKK